MTQVFIGAGSNLGNREANLRDALKSLSGLPGIKIIKESPVYETDPVGGPVQGKYLNAVWEMESELSVKELLKELLSLEAQMGRKRSVPNAPRTLDLDILFYGTQRISDGGLEIPHPRLHERWFVLKPMADIAPGFIHPVLKKSIQTLLEENFARNPKS